MSTLDRIHWVGVVVAAGVPGVAASAPCSEPTPAHDVEAAALAVEAAQMATFKPNQVAHRMVVPGTLMGQHWQRAPGPDGWPEEDSNWITPQGLSARVRWAMTAPRLLRPDLPDPKDFVGEALGGYASEPVRFAAAAAETRAEAVGLVLSAPAFQRR